MFQYFFSFINVDLWFRCQVYLAFVTHKRLCIEFQYYLGLALQNQETVSELLDPSFGVWKVRAVEILQFVIFLPHFWTQFG